MKIAAVQTILDFWGYFNFYAYSVLLILDVDEILCKMPHIILLSIYNFYGN